MACLVLVAAAGGCRSGDEVVDNAPRSVSPQDFDGALGQGVADGQDRLLDVMRADEQVRGVPLLRPLGAGRDGDEAERGTTRPRDEGEADAEPDAGPSARAGEEVFLLDGMVGQVNGEAIYAREVFEPIHDQLAALGRQLSRDAFRREAANQIAARLQQMVIDALILGEAERALTEPERQGLRFRMEQQREELLRKYGQGAPTLANQRLIEETGQGLEANLSDFRDAMVVNNYVAQQITPKINVTRKDVERAYAERADEFNPPVQRTVRLIRVADPAEAQQVRAALGSGVPFVEIASDAPNAYKPEAGGLVGQELAGQEIFGSPKLNDAVMRLPAGGFDGPIELGEDYCFVYVERIDRPESTPLREVQVDLERELRRQQFRDLSARYRAELFREGSYNPIEEMAETLLDMAMARYAPAPGSAGGER